MAFDIIFNEEGKIIDILSGNVLENKPEERVRQGFIKTLIDEYGYNKKQIAREVGIYCGRNELKDSAGNFVRADIVVYEDTLSCKTKRYYLLWNAKLLTKEKDTTSLFPIFITRALPAACGITGAELILE